MLLSEQDLARFRRHLSRDPVTGCLLWTGYRDRDGHGRFSHKSKRLYAHRVAWTMAGHAITPDKPHILHFCPNGDNPACCEEKHLRAGTHLDNMLDLLIKGQGAKSRRGLPFGVKITRGGRFVAQMWRDRKLLYLGTFATLEEAAAVALDAKTQWVLERLSRIGGEA